MSDSDLFLLFFKRNCILRIFVEGFVLLCTGLVSLYFRCSSYRASVSDLLWLLFDNLEHFTTSWIYSKGGGGVGGKRKIELVWGNLCNFFIVFPFPKVGVLMHFTEIHRIFNFTVWITCRCITETVLCLGIYIPPVRMYFNYKVYSIWITVSWKIALKIRDIFSKMWLV